jgi:hypothetical protein
MGNSSEIFVKSMGYVILISEGELVSLHKGCAP